MTRILKTCMASTVVVFMGTLTACIGGDAGTYAGTGVMWDAEYRYQIQGERGQETVILHFKGEHRDAVGPVKFRLKQDNEVVGEEQIHLNENGKGEYTFYSDIPEEPQGALKLEVEWNKKKETVPLKPAGHS
ncbi:hypothetical protein [Staphylospora marina]|uniref:hypothetical protein n=1 Tax=Staphylospora marina TaxID=2490858 RepID=UPI000F5BFA24|nr:hypothetical protein [Staphylospora marina]